MHTMTSAITSTVSTATHEFIIRPMKESDYPQVQAILQHGMDSGEATFERYAPEWEDFISHRISDLLFVAEDNDGTILGWITGSKVSHRAVFHGVIEDSVYTSPQAAGKGVGGALLDHLLRIAGDNGYWAVHTTTFPDNAGSVKLHESRGFQRVGTFHSMAQMTYGPKEGQWRHILMLEKIIENGPAWEQ